MTVSRQFEEIEKPGALKVKMAASFREFARWMARAYLTLPEPAQKKALAGFGEFEGQIDRFYERENWTAFQAVLVQVRALFNGLHQTKEPDDGPHNSMTPDLPGVSSMARGLG